MNLSRLFVVFAFAGWAAAASAVSVDHDASADFTKYKTFSHMPGTPAANPLNEKRIQDAIDTELAAKGLTKVEAGGDVIVVTHAALKEEQRISVDQYGYGGPGWGGYSAGYRGGYAYSTTSVNSYTVRVGHLLVDMFDGQSKQVVWRGEASDLVSDKPEKNAARITKAVQKLFKKYPPPR